jgi:acetoacetyl-CoA reductase
MGTKNHVCLVTEGLQGVGAAVCRALLDAGHTVLAHCSKKQSDEEEEIPNLPSMFWDVSDADQCRYNLDIISNRYGPVDILIHNINLFSDAPCHKMDVKDWERIICSNLCSCFYLANPILPSMREKHFGRFVFISSVRAERGQLNQANYCASKAGVLGFMKTLALEGASRGITANAVAPGCIDEKPTRESNSAVLATIPMNRTGTPKEVADSVAFLISDSASYITGETLQINGGQYIV